MKKNTITVNQLKEHLKAYDQADLMELVCEISKTCSQAKDFLTMKFLGTIETQNIIEAHKEKIRHEFFPKRGHGRLDLREAKKAISEFKKISTDKKLILDLMLFYVENGVEFTKAYGDISETFYSSMESMFGQAIKLLNSEKTDELLQFFLERIHAIIQNAIEGWGFQDSLKDLYSDLKWVEED